jgi:hypothetical protein
MNILRLENNKLAPTMLKLKIKPFLRRKGKKKEKM